ncbi:MAG: VgrG-related protein [Fimbriimonas sp.]
MPEYVNDIEIQVSGAKLTEKLANDLVECIVDDSISLPSACTLRFIIDMTTPDGSGLEAVESATFKVGSEVTVKMGTLARKEQVFKGEITGHEVDFNGMGISSITVRAYHKIHRMMRGNNSAAFLDVKDSNVIIKLANSNGLRNDVDATKVLHKSIIQNNQSDWQFAQFLAKRNSYRLYGSDSGGLCFKKLNRSSPPVAVLEYGETLRAFRPKTSTANQVQQVKVKGWDPVSKSPITGQSANPDGIPMGPTDGKAESRVFGTKTFTVVQHEITDATHATALAQSVFDELGGEFLQAEALIFGEPKIRAGDIVKIKGVGERFSGDYIVTSATHTFSQSGGFMTELAMDGRGDSTMIGHFEEREWGSAIDDNYACIAIVTSNTDPEDRGRVKVNYPWLDAEVESFWARVAAPGAGAKRGIFFLPEVGDEVVVVFEHGNINQPIVIGGLWNGKDIVVEKNSQAVDGGVNRRFITSRTGNQISMDDKLEYIEVLTPAKSTIKLDDKNKVLEMKDSSGNSVKIESTHGDITIKANGVVTIDAMGDIILKSKANVSIQAMANMELKATGTGKFEAMGQLDIQGTAGTNVKSAAMVVVQGTLVKIN